MKLMKVFDCQDMPKDICLIFLRSWDNKCNDVYVNWTVETDIVSKWLLQNGADLGEKVIVKYWW